MCLLLLGIDVHPGYRLILAANRDEFYDRPTAQAAFWKESPNLLAGRDLKEGGTWLGITRQGRLSAITNYRDPASNKADAPSRGGLVTDFLLSRENPETYLGRLSLEAHRYNGFNLVVGCDHRYYWYSNRGDKPHFLAPGIYGICNHLLNTPWPKVAAAKAAFKSVISRNPVLAPEPFLELLSNAATPSDEELPNTGVGMEWERILGPVFVQSDTYGTRSSTVLLVSRENRVTLVERTFNGRPHSHQRDVKFDFYFGS
jgi:uncharacterized protein with NRDE domain